MALITYTEAQAALPGSTGTSDQTLIETLITRADRMLVRACWPDLMQASTLEDTSYTIYVDGPSRTHPRRLVLPARPVVSISSIGVDTAGNWGYATTLSSSTDYSADTEDLANGWIWLKPNATSISGWPSAPKSIKVVATIGYATVDEAIKDAAVRLVRWLWDNLEVQGIATATRGAKNEQRATTHWHEIVGLTQLPCYMPEGGCG